MLVKKDEDQAMRLPAPEGLTVAQKLDSSQFVMSSREIAQLTKKQHRNVLADCEKLNDEYRKMTLAEISAGVYSHSKTGKQQHREFLLTKIQTLDLITGYDIQMRIKVNRRWEQLETERANPFYGLPSMEIKGETWLPYRAVLEHVGCSLRSGSYHGRMRRFPNEFFAVAGVVYATLAICLTIKHNHELLAGRKAIAARNPKLQAPGQLSLFEAIDNIGGLYNGKLSR